MLALILVAAVIGLLGYKDLRDLEAPRDDAGWTIFQIGFEHQRLLLAAETGAPQPELRLRGDLYLSRVILLRDAPMLQNLRDAMDPGELTKLFKSAQATDGLIDLADTREGHEALLHELRDDAQSVRELMLDMTSLNRELQSEERTKRTRTLLVYLGGLESLLVALLCLGVLVMRTTSDLRRANKEIAAQFATHDAVMRSVDDAIIGVSAGGEVLYSNPRAAEMLGPAAASGARMAVAAARDDDLAAQVWKLAREPFHQDKDGVAAGRKVQLTMPEGPRTYVLRKFRSAPAGPARAGSDSSFIVTISDVTTEEEAAQRREEYDARIGEMSRLLAYAAISGGIVHEISQPLAAIRNYIYALKVSFDLHPGAPEHRTIAQHLGEEIDRAIEVVRNVRRMGPQDPQDPGVCNIGEAIAHSVRLVTLGRSPPPPIEIVQEPADMKVNGSLPLIGQVIVNLLKNALSASAAAGRRGAAVKVMAEGDLARIEVADFGAGVSPDAAKSIFMPFSKSARGGMGLGLAICQRIASTLGGSLSWTNREGSGAIFTFTVPLAKEGNPS